MIRAQVTPATILAAASSGDHHAWAAAWATDSLQQAVATQAYVVSLTNGQRKTAHHSAEEYVQARITTPAKAAYTPARVAPASDQLVKAAVRLADLLNAVAWK